MVEERTQSANPRTYDFSRITNPPKNVEEIDKEIAAAIKEYASIPVLLSDDTLRNPYVARYSDALGIRYALTPEDRATVEKALKAAQDDYSSCINNKDSDGANWSEPVVIALANKLKTTTIGETIANSLLFNAPEYIDSNSTRWASPTDSQLQYLGGNEFMQYANPFVSRNTEEAMGLYNYASLGKGLLKADLLTANLTSSNSWEKIVPEIAKWGGGEAIGNPLGNYADRFIGDYY